MPSTYTDLKIELLATGEADTTWGDKSNSNFEAFQEAITGSANVAFSSANVTLTLTNTSASQTARNLRLNLTGTATAGYNLIVPAIEKQYIISNGTDGTITVKNSTGTGVAVPAGTTTIVFNNGTNVVDAMSYATTFTAATLNATNLNVTSQAQFNWNTLAKPKLQAVRETVTTVASAGTATYTFDLSTSNNWDITMTGNPTLAFSNPPPSGTLQAITVLFRQDGTGNRTLTYPASVKWTDNIAPVLATGANKVDVLTFFTVDGGTTYYGAQALANL
jgi:hypothetical protein